MALDRVERRHRGCGRRRTCHRQGTRVAGYHVVLLERGRFYQPSDCRKDDLYNQRTNILGNSFGPDSEGEPRVVVDGKGRERIVLPWEGGYNTNAGCVGGGTLSYGAMAWRFHPLDFQMKTKYGAIKDSTLDDWPVTYDDLEPYYEKAEWEIGVSGDDSNNPFKGARKRRLPMPPVGPPSKEHKALDAAARRIGLHPFDIPMLRNSVPYNGRPACMRCRWCVGFACEVDAKCGTQNTVLRTALKTGNLELRTECMTREVMVDDKGHAIGIAYYDENGRLQEQPASVVVVSCGATESSRCC